MFNNSKNIVIKIGGSTLGNHDTTIEDVVELQKRHIPLIIVHGGGKLITEWLNRMGIKASFINGERVTDIPTLEIATGVLTGVVNKEIVTAITGKGGKAFGISGADGGLICSEIKNPELGYVGHIVKIQPEPLHLLLQAGYIPVIATIGLNYRATGNEPRLLNINADDVAGILAVAMRSEKLVFLTDVDGVRSTEGKIISSLSPDEAENLIKSGVASGGMIPKLNACIKAARNNIRACIIDGRKPHSLLRYLEGAPSGTVIE